MNEMQHVNHDRFSILEAYARTGLSATREKKRVAAARKALREASEQLSEWSELDGAKASLEDETRKQREEIRTLAERFGRAKNGLAAYMELVSAKEALAAAIEAHESAEDQVQLVLPI